MRLLKDSYQLSNTNNIYVLEVLKYNCCRVAFAVRRCNIKALWCSVETPKTVSSLLEPQAVFADHILRKHVKRFSDLDYQFTISNEKLAAAVQQLSDLKQALG